MTGRLVAAAAALALIAAACTGAPGTDLAATGNTGTTATSGATTGDDGVEDGTDQPGEADTETTGSTVATSSGSSSGSGSGRSGGDSTPTTTGATPTTSASPGAFTSTLWSGRDDTRGITDDEIVICAHAALTYGAAFNTGEEDLNVYWTEINSQGGVHGRSVRVEYENDNYSPDTAVQAASACKDNHDPFMIIGGIGFDQIPAVREWAETNEVLYFHHTATVNGTQGKQYSYTGLPTTEKTGEMFAEVVISKFAGKRVGIIKRASENWEPGIVGFKALAERHGVDIAVERSAQVNKGNYLDDIVALRNADVEVAFIWLNALETTEFILQAKNQAYSPQFLVFPFNLITQTVGEDALDPPLMGVAMFNGYSFGDRSGEFARYADDLDEFERQYAEHRPSADIGGVGGDLLFLNWQGQKALHKLLVQCGPDCTRNRFVELLHGFKQKLSTSVCTLDYTRPGPGNDKRGGWDLSVLQAYRAPDGNVNFHNIHTCVEHLI
ncbi:MAG TPA: ABC transporter substrate-binding protein [Acidimicrobiales bacterium]